MQIYLFHEPVDSALELRNHDRRRKETPQPQKTSWRWQSRWIRGDYMEKQLQVRGPAATDGVWQHQIVHHSPRIGFSAGLIHNLILCAQNPALDQLQSILK